MALDRDATLKNAEKLVRQGRLDLAIAEYLRVIEDNPGEWSPAITLGDLYVKTGQPAQAVGEYTRIGNRFVDQGFYPKAAALYRKILKIVPNDEDTQIRLADVSARQGLLADARSHLNSIAAKRRARGDRRGTAEIVVRLGTIDPADLDARLAAAKTLEEMGEAEEAGIRFKALYHDLLEKDRPAEALDALKAFVGLNPLDSDARAILARAALAAGDVGRAREFLDEHSAGTDPALLLPLAEIELQAGEVTLARTLIDRLLTADPGQRSAVYALGGACLEEFPETAFACIEAAVDSAVSAKEFDEGASRLQDFIGRVPGHIPALLKLVEVCVDGGLELAMYEAQEKLTDAYLAAGQAAEARAIAEDLVAREPWESVHIDRFRKALVMLRVSDPDTLIAERLSGQAPFMARDPFFDPPPDAVPAAEAAESADPADDEATRPEPVDEASVDVPVGDPAVEPAPVPQPAAAAAPAGGSASADEIDLTGALGNLDGPAEAPSRLDQVFSDIRAEAADAGDDTASQHMTLARTYLEIGMLDEAQASLETAVRSPRLRFEAAAALGRLQQRRGDNAAAIEWLERAAEAPAPTPDEGHRLLYDLGVMLEAESETSRALAVFLELQSDAGDYLDVPSRIDRLSRVQTGG